MTTTFSTQVARVKARLLTDTTTAQPNDATLTLWCIDAAKACMGKLPPVTVTTSTVSTSAYTATVVGTDVYYVAFKDQVLFPSEWSGRGTTTLRFTPGSVDYGGTITYYRLNTAVGNGNAVLTDASTSVDTSCLLGQDWLEEISTVTVMMQVMARLTAVSTTGDGPNYMSAYRVLQEERTKLEKELRAAWDAWRNGMEAVLQARSAVGDLPLRESPGAGLRNNSRVINALTGVP